MRIVWDDTHLIIFIFIYILIKRARATYINPALWAVHYDRSRLDIYIYIFSLAWYMPNSPIQLKYLYRYIYINKFTYTMKLYLCVLYPQLIISHICSNLNSQNHLLQNMTTYTIKCELGLLQMWQLTTKYNQLSLRSMIPNFFFGYHKIPHIFIFLYGCPFSKLSNQLMPSGISSFYLGSCFEF